MTREQLMDMPEEFFSSLDLAVCISAFFMSMPRYHDAFLSESDALRELYRYFRGDYPDAVFSLDQDARA